MIDAVLAQRLAYTEQERLAVERDREDYKAKLRADIADFEATAHRLGIMRMVERQRDLKPKIQDVLDDIYNESCERPATLENLAMLLDVALDQEIDIVSDAQEPKNTAGNLPFTALLLYRIRQRVPGFEFTSLRRALTAEQYDALMIDPDESATETSSLANNLMALIARVHELDQEFISRGLDAYTDNELQIFADTKRKIIEQIERTRASTIMELLAKAGMTREALNPRRYPDSLAVSLIRDIESMFA